jgi:hypothetical protein
MCTCCTPLDRFDSPQMPDGRHRATKIDDHDIDARVQATDTNLTSLLRPTEGARRTVQIAHLSAVDPLLRRSERETARGTNLYAHELVRRTGIDGDDVDLVAADLHVARDHSPLALSEPRDGDVLRRRATPLLDCAHNATIFVATYLRLCRSQMH